jgi:hypothetical protein
MAVGRMVAWRASRSRGTATAGRGTKVVMVRTLGLVGVSVFCGVEVKKEKEERRRTA